MFWADIATQPWHAPIELTEYMLEALCEVIPASGASLGFHRKEQLFMRRPGTFLGWSRQGKIAFNRSAQEHFVDHLSPDPSHPLFEDVVMAHMKLMGVTRAYRWCDVLDGRTVMESAAAELYRKLGLQDRLFGVLNVSPTFEIALYMERELGAPDFEAADAEVMEVIIRSLSTLLLRSAMAMGMMDGQIPLTSREQETLKGLLSGISEKELAVQLNLTPRTIHQYVTSIYRKLQVNSRAQLMAIFLSPPPLATSSRPLTPGLVEP